MVFVGGPSAEYEVVENHFIKDGCYLDPSNSIEVDRRGFRLSQNILLKRFDQYKQRPPLLLPLMRGGTRPFLNVSGSFRYFIKYFRSLLGNDVDIGYVPINISRYGVGEINSEGRMRVDEHDLAQAYYALKNYDEAVIVDDVFDKGITTKRIRDSLQQNGKSVIIATLDRKPELKQVDIDTDFWVKDYFIKMIGGRQFPPWIVYPWEIDDHSRELWQLLFPEFKGLHPQDVIDHFEQGLPIEPF